MAPKRGCGQAKSQTLSLKFLQSQAPLRGRGRGRGRGQGRGGRGRGAAAAPTPTPTVVASNSKPQIPQNPQPTARKTDPFAKSQILSSPLKLQLSDAPAAFGDVEDIFNEKFINNQGGGTIIFNINVRRKFMQGEYKMHIIKSKTKDKHAAKYSAILCREDVDPMKIHKRLQNSTYSTWDFRLSNGISRYDWKHFRNWGDFDDLKKKKAKDDYDFDSDMDMEFDFDDFYRMGHADNWGSSGHDFFWTQVKGRAGWTPPSTPEKKKKPEEPTKTPEELAKEAVVRNFKINLIAYFKKKKEVVKQCTLFVDSAAINEISEGDFTIEEDNDWVHLIKGKVAVGVGGKGKDKSKKKEEEQLLGFIVKEAPTKPKKIIEGDWHYGCVLQDSGSEEYFAFVFGDNYIDYDDDGRDLSDDLAAANYVCDINKMLI